MSPAIAEHEKNNNSKGINLKNSGIGTSALVVGIVAVVFSFIPMLGLWSLPLGAVAIILASIGLAKAKKIVGMPKGFSITGLITGIVAVIAGVVHVAIFMFVGAVASSVDQSISETTSVSPSTSIESSDSDTNISFYDNATSSAQSYVDMGNMSEKSLKNQLEFEGFEDDEISIALKEVDVDYNEEAVGSLESYVDLADMSKSGLRTQLEFEGYTDSQVDYAMSTLTK